MDTKFKTKQQRAEEIMDELAATGSYYGRDHKMLLEPGHVVTVTDRRTGALVAYSSTKADFDDSVAEFVYDYLV